ncbi:MAG: DUF1330 domain-containing protein [Acidimicrobiia bacterium]|nr:DUF1330 domain-containing protein [Acidimicrobiia bacterium]
MATIEPSSEQLQRFAGSVDDGPVVMLNLLRYAERADDDSGRTGREAYAEYGAAVVPMVLARGGSIELMGEMSPSLIAPADEDWDEVVLIRYPSRAAFLDMITSAEYRAVQHHRTVALADSRLLPLRRTDA